MAIILGVDYDCITNFYFEPYVHFFGCMLYLIIYLMPVNYRLCYFTFYCPAVFHDNGYKLLTQNFNTVSCTDSNSYLLEY
jgi:hypothetical protein